MSQKSPPAAPDYAREFERGLQVYMKYLPKQLREEMQLQRKWDPRRIEHMMHLQDVYGPRQAQQQLAAVQRLDPLYVRMRNLLGGRIAEAVQRGYTSPTRKKAYEELGTSTRGQLARGTNIDPAFRDQLVQSIRAGQAARGNIRGNAPATAEALYQGQRGQQLLGQRQQATQNFLGLQTPESEAIAQAGSFSSLPSMIDMVNRTPGVNPPRGYGYFNPNAGPMGAQFALQQYPQQLSQYQLAGGGSNPWMNALAGAASGAASGSMVNFPYGTIVGAGVGGAAGYFG